MTIAKMLYGKAGEVADDICSRDPALVTHEDLIAALGNALHRIEQLEAGLDQANRAIQKADDGAYHAANIASCLANGIQPD